MTLPLEGLTIIEMAGLGPGPFAAMMLADHGARVVRVERAGMIAVPNDPLLRNRQSISLDLKREDHRGVVHRLATNADGLIEGYRPGVMERLGLGPDALQAVNPRLVYGRVTGWGQDGPLANSAGHDIDYLALTGLLHAMGEPDRPPRPPMNLVADYAGGGMMLAFGMAAALLDVQRGAAGRVIDSAMTDGAALTGALIYGLKAAGAWNGGRGNNLLDGGDPLYRCYRCADGNYLALGAIEPQFRRALLEGLGIAEATKEAVAATIETRTRDEWVERFAGIDACVAPVLDMDEAPDHPHNRARKVFVAVGGVVQPMPAPRYGERPPVSPPRQPGEDGPTILRSLGYDAPQIDELLS
ncbi:CaiB/BaiF CoA transferase family protein [Sphingomonas jaspsi]|uniref:CaiB/BaiF CoA transferase family protein n=1 Tax=Sphingomonas jaspsi TaxID=392409 RepID=UPI0006880A0F|nr:CaiB/BaiF CoA-transferase family protein [Sphingomonas jaspsi]